MSQILFLVFPSKHVRPTHFHAHFHANVYANLVHAAPGYSPVIASFPSCRHPSARDSAAILSEGRSCQICHKKFVIFLRYSHVIPHVLSEKAEIKMWCDSDRGIKPRENPIF